LAILTLSAIDAANAPAELVSPQPCSGTANLAALDAFNCPP